MGNVLTLIETAADGAVKSSSSTLGAAPPRWSALLSPWSSPAPAAAKTWPVNSASWAPTRCTSANPSPSLQNWAAPPSAHWRRPGCLLSGSCADVQHQRLQGRGRPAGCGSPGLCGRRRRWPPVRRRRDHCPTLRVRRGHHDRVNSREWSRMTRQMTRFAASSGNSPTTVAIHRELWLASLLGQRNR